MYKAIQKETNKEVVILDPVWVETDQLALLKSWGQDDLLVCQECKQPVRVRTGQLRAWHFAHKHRQNCSVGYESPQLLQARALLYRWLVGKFGPERVTLEKRLERPPDWEELPRPVDCWVKGVNGQPDFAYWVFEAAMKPYSRDILRLSLFAPGIIVAYWVFLTDMLRQNEGDTEAVILTTTEREFMGASTYDKMYPSGGHTLHYLDHTTGQLLTYRGLHLVHSPQIYQGKLLCHPMEEILISPRSGELSHPGEYDRLKTYEAEQERLKAEREKRRSAAPAVPPAPPKNGRPLPP